MTDLPPTSPDIDALKARLYAALEHNRWCPCGGCSGGKNAVDSLVNIAKDTENNCNICGVPWPNHHEACAYVGNVRDLYAAIERAEDARMKERAMTDYFEDASRRAEEWQARAERAEEERDEAKRTREAALTLLVETEEAVEAAEARVAELEKAVERELRVLERWAGEQNAGNVFAEQVLYQAQDWLAALATPGTKEGAA